MAKGDVQDFVKRLNDVIPPWFGQEYPTLNAMFNGFATMDSYIYFLTQYAKEQMRIQTASGQNLDLVACDFFEGYLERPEGMNDNQFRKWIEATLLQPLATRSAMENALFIVTGYYPIIWEPFQIDGGCFYDDINSFYDDDSFYGSLLDPYNFWIEVFVPDPTANGTGFFDGNDSWFDGDLTDHSFYAATESDIWNYDQILALINRVKVGGTVPHLTLTYI